MDPQWVMAENSGGILKCGETKSKQKVTVNSCDDTLFFTLIHQLLVTIFSSVLGACGWLPQPCAAWVGTPGKHVCVCVFYHL